MLQWISMQIIFTARHYASAVYAVIVCLSACLSVCLSVRPYVRNEPLMFRNDWTDPPCFCHWGFLPPVLHCITRKFGYLCISKNKGIFPRICIQKISPRQVDRVVSKTHDVWACWPHLRRSTRRGCTRRGYYYLYTSIVMYDLLWICRTVCSCICAASSRQDFDRLGCRA